MAEPRLLPVDRNPMLEEDKAPNHEILVERRCLGQTELKVKPGQMGTSNATKPENLGVLDYAHLRVPLPKDLRESGIFSRGTNRKFPEAYFLMRRSSDGFVSATGMFKAAFPYAQQEEETAEKDYIKALPATSSEEVAGNVWIHPDEALALADEYGIRLWIAALLDPQPITHGTSDPTKDIQSPPTYRFKEVSNGVSRSPDTKKTPGAKRSTRGARSLRSESPSKPKPAAAAAGRAKATPGRGRGRKGQASVDETASVRSDEPLAETTREESEKVTIEAVTTTRLSATGEEEVENTKVTIGMPLGHPDLPLPHDAQEMLAQARAMVKDAEKMAGASTGQVATTSTSSSSSRTTSKRKAEEMIDAEDAAEGAGPAGPPAKRSRRIEVELRKEKVKRRALTGIAAGLALGALIPTVAAAFQWV